MKFSNLTFILFFLPIFILIYYGVSAKLKSIVLALTCLIFLACAEPFYIFLFIFSFLIVYLLSRITESLHAYKTISGIITALGILVSLLVLLIFSLGTPIISNSPFLVANKVDRPNFILLLGGSVFTIQSISYLLEVQKGDCPAQKNILNLFCYIFFFPTVHAGPILTYSEFSDCFSNQEISVSNLADGITTIIKGFSKIVLLANPCMAIFEQITSADISALSLLNAWLASTCFIFCFYFTLLGYADMASGIGLVIGIRLPENFNYPFTAKSVSEFFSRFNSTFTKWVKQFILPAFSSKLKRWLSIPLCSFTFCILVGLYYKQSINALIFGAYFAIFYSLERFFLRKLLYRIPTAVRILYCYIVLTVGSVFLAFDSPSRSFSLIKCMFGAGSGNAFTLQKNGLYLLLGNAVLLIICGLLLSELPKRVCEKIKAKTPFIFNMLNFICPAVMLLVSICFAAV